MLTQLIFREATSLAPSFDILKSLDVFLTVADAGSMTIASRRLGVTQSAISQQIKLLEAEFGTSLFDRQDRPLTLTAAGAALYERAGRLVLDVKETWTFVRQSAAMSLPHLRLAVLSTVARDLVPALMAATDTSELPIQHLSVMRGVSQGHMQDLINRKTDVAITSEALYRHESIERYPLLREKYVVIVPKGAMAPDAQFNEIVNSLPFIRYTSRITSGQLIELHFRRLQLDLTPKFAFESPEDLISNVAAGYGWSVVAPSQLAHVPEYASKIDTYLLPAPGLERTITLITRKGEFSNVTSVLVRLCRNVLHDKVVARAASLLPGLEDICALIDDTPDEIRCSGRD